MLISGSDIERLRITLPTVLSVVTNGNSISVWAYNVAQHRDGSGSQQPSGAEVRQTLRLNPGECHLSARARQLLGVENGATITVLLPPREFLQVRPGFVEDVPRATEADVTRETYDRFSDGIRFRNRYALASNGKLCMPVRLRNRVAVTPGSVRLSMAARVLLGGVRVGDQVQISEFPPGDLSSPGPWTRQPRRAAALARSLRLPFRAIDQVLEWIIRPVLRAPSISLLTEQATIGDDDELVVRIPEHTLALLGIESGDQIIVSWGYRQAVAVAFTIPDQSSSQTTSRIFDSQGVERILVDENDLREQLTIQVASRLRLSLGIPATTVVRVRRRLRTYLVNRLGRATLPVGGLILAALAVPGGARVPAVVATSIIFAFQLISFRYPSPPKGKWPFW